MYYDRPWTFLLPAHFDIHVLPPKLRRNPDYCWYFLDAVIRKKLQRNVDLEGYAHLHSRVLRKALNWRIQTPIIETLIEAGVIERSYYVVRKSSYGYRLTDPYLSDSHIRVPPCSELMVARLARFQEEFRERQRSRRLPVHDCLQAAQERLTIDLASARGILAGLPQNTLFCQRVLVENLITRELGFSISSTWRVFNALTGLKRELREALLLDGEPLASIDLTCCQPALIVLLCEGICPAEKLRSVATCKECTWLGSEESWLAWSLDCCVLAELAEFRELVCGGGFYEELVAETGLERDEVKLSVLRDVLARRGTYTTPVWEAFERRWPSILRFIRSVNKGHHANLIRLLQRAEAWLVVEQVAPLLVDRIPIVTLHDAIYGRERDLSIVKAAFEEAFERIGFRLRLKEEFWGQESMAT